MHACRLLLADSGSKLVAGWLVSSRCFVMMDAFASSRIYNVLIPAAGARQKVRHRQQERVKPYSFRPRDIPTIMQGLQTWPCL